MVQVPYLVLAGVVLLVAVAVALVRLPDIRTHGREHALGPGGLWSVLRTPSLGGAVLAQFFYVGAQVGIWSFFVDFVKDLTPATPERTAAYLLSFSLVLFMTGRFIGTALMHRIRPVQLLLSFAVANVALCALAVTTPGVVAVGALTLTSFFMSIMFPTIFALGVRDLGEKASLGAPLLIMAIIGGAIFPPLMGLLAQVRGDIQPAMLLPLLCFAVVAVYAYFRGRSDTSAAARTLQADARQ
jgi:FHS family L-fucose permease-like MFS transporter